MMTPQMARSRLREKLIKNIDLIIDQASDRICEYAVVPKHITAYNNELKYIISQYEEAGWEIEKVNGSYHFHIK